MGNTNAISIKQTAIKYPADKAANAQPTPNSVAATMTRFRANAKPYKHKPAAANCTDMPPKKCPAIIKPAQPIKIKATLWFCCRPKNALPAKLLAANPIAVNVTLAKRIAEYASVISGDKILRYIAATHTYTGETLKYGSSNTVGSQMLPPANKALTASFTHGSLGRHKSCENTPGHNQANINNQPIQGFS